MVDKNISERIDSIITEKEKVNNLGKKEEAYKE